VPGGRESVGAGVGGRAAPGVVAGDRGSRSESRGRPPTTAAGTAEMAVSVDDVRRGGLSPRPESDSRGRRRSGGPRAGGGGSTGFGGWRARTREKRTSVGIPTGRVRGSSPVSSTPLFPPYTAFRVRICKRARHVNVHVSWRTKRASCPLLAPARTASMVQAHVALPGWYAQSVGLSMTGVRLYTVVLSVNKRG
jgi:hypothetical protein